MSMIAKRTGAHNRVVLPDGQEVNTRRAEALGYTVESLNDQFARQHPDRNARALFDRAVRHGASMPPAAAPAQTKGQAMIAYAQQIEALPEAKNRPAAASELWSKYTEQTMPVERAAAFLRGLPEEIAPVAKAPAQSQLDPKQAAMFQRKVEIKILGLNMKADRGNNNAARNRFNPENGTLILWPL